MRAKLCVLSVALSLVGAEMAPAQTRIEPTRSPAAKDDVKGPLTLQGVQGGAPAPTGRPAGSGRPVVTAVRATQPPAIDGRLDDAIWRDAALIDKFVQEEPIEGAPASEQTEIRIAYDSERLYVGIYAHYADVSSMRTNRSDRDRLDNDDTVTVFLEPFLDYLRGYTFAVNGYGVQRDSMVVVNNAQSTASGDLSFNALYYSGGQLVADGWTAEMAIPFKSLRYPGKGAGEVHRWGFQVRREIKNKDESAVWSPVSRNNPNFLGQIGMLTGITNLSVQRNFELLPTFTAVNSGRIDPATGEFGSDHVEEGGVGLKYGINSNLTFDFTYNPDFSNIESETQQIEVNQRFPIDYPELRPFFLEGREIYEIPGRPTPVQTRNIVDPRYGAKLTGKVGTRSSIGLFVADDEAPGKVEFNDPRYGQKSQNVLGRYKYDLYRNSHVGVIFTDREFMKDYSRLVMLDAALRMGETGNFGWRYYKTNREDTVADASVERAGWATEMSIRQNTRSWNWAFIANAISPEFSNALSFVQRVNQIQIMTPQFSYRWYPESWIRSWGPGFNSPRLYDFTTHQLQNADYTPNVSFTFAKNITLSANYNHALERYREIDFYKDRWSMSGTVNTSRKVLLSWNVNNGDQIRFIANPFLGRLLVYGMTATFRPFSRLQSVLKVDANRFSDPVNHAQEFNIKIMRSTTTYQFTPRLLLRNITELNTGQGSNHTLFQNILVTYRVNSGTVFYVGYDDRFKEGNAVNAKLFSDPSYLRTNRAIFTKIQYLFRSGGAGSSN
jgi:uncharacterized protein DUF5916/cellulose/xylan binding protein with CBM9 domain